MLVSQKSGSDGVVHLVLSELVDSYKVLGVSITNLGKDRIKKDNLVVLNGIVVVGLGYQSWRLVRGHH